jgi:hypothetical protein
MSAGGGGGRGSVVLPGRVELCEVGLQVECFLCVQFLLFVASYSEVLEVSYGGRGEGGMERGRRTERHCRGVEDVIRSPARPR